MLVEQHTLKGLLQQIVLYKQQRPAHTYFGLTRSVHLLCHHYIPRHSLQLQGQVLKLD